MAERQTKSVAIDTTVFLKCQRAAAMNKMPMIRWMNMVLTEVADKSIAEGNPLDRKADSQELPNPRKDNDLFPPSGDLHSGT